MVRKWSARRCDIKHLRSEILPSSLPPIGINREQAAALVGISVTLYDKAVEAGTMPRPRLIGGRQVYDVEELIKAFRALPHKGGDAQPLDGIEAGSNPWD